MPIPDDVSLAENFLCEGHPFMYCRYKPGDESGCKSDEGHFFKRLFALAGGAQDQFHAIAGV